MLECFVKLPTKFCLFCFIVLGYIGMLIYRVY